MTIPDRQEGDAYSRARDVLAEYFYDDEDGVPQYHLADKVINAFWRANIRLTEPPPNGHEGPYPFVLVRDEDVTGVSGTGVVAEGVEFTGPDGEGVVALRWLSDWPTSVVFHDRGLESVKAVHGHGGKTRVVWQ